MAPALQVTGRRVGLLALYATALFLWHQFLGTYFVSTTPTRPQPAALRAQERFRARLRNDAALKQIVEEDIDETTQSYREPKRSSSPPPPTTTTAAPTTAVATTAASYTTTAPKCEPKPHVELDGAVVRDGIGPKGLSLAPAECCEACRTTRGCNVWVACADPNACQSQCWLKWVESEGVLRERGAGPNVPWTSGLLAKDFPGSVPMPPAEALAAVRIVALHTPFGDLRIRLRPDWHAPSVEYVQRVALQDVCTAKCVFYRAEPGFLLQGALRAVVAPNKKCRAFRGGPAECKDPQERPGGNFMEKGDVAWAGGSAGPDFFIMMNRNGFGASHTVWGSMADDESMELALKLVQGKSNSKPGTMRMLSEEISFTASPAEAKSA